MDRFPLPLLRLAFFGGAGPRGEANGGGGTMKKELGKARLVAVA